MNLNLKKQLFALLVFFVLVVSLPIILYLVSKRQEIRPRALTGNATLHLNTDNVNQNAGNEFQVWVSLSLNDAKLRVSGADFVLLYDKVKLEALSIVPVITSVDSGAAFTDAPVVMKDGNFDSTYNFLRVGLVAKRKNSDLKGGTVSLARVRFKAKANGQASIKFPDDNKYLEVVGISYTASLSPTPTPGGGGPSPTPTTGSGQPTPTPTLSPGVIVNSASGKSCDELCPLAVSGSVCLDVGLNAAATDNSMYSYFSDPANPEQNHCQVISGSSVTCSRVMEDKQQTVPPTCGGKKAEWTYCKCGTAAPANSPTPTPAGPSGLTRSCRTASDEADFSWNAVNGVSKYIFRISKEPAEDWFNPEGGDQWACVSGTSATRTIPKGEPYELWSVQSSGGANCKEADGTTNIEYGKTIAEGFICPAPTNTPVPPTPTSEPPPPQNPPGCPGGSCDRCPGCCTDTAHCGDLPGGSSGCDSFCGN